MVQIGVALGMPTVACATLRKAPTRAWAIVLQLALVLDLEQGSI